MAEKIPKDWQMYFKKVEGILIKHAREIALETVQTLYFNNFKIPSSKIGRVKKKKL